MSFVIDPPLLVASGAAIETAAGGENPHRARQLRTGVVALFVGVSLALYANVPGLSRIWRPFGAQSGREFMVGSGLARIDEESMSTSAHVAALSMFTLYPLWAWLGSALVRTLRRSAG